MSIGGCSSGEWLSGKFKHLAKFRTMSAQVKLLKFIYLYEVFISLQRSSPSPTLFSLRLFWCVMAYCRFWQWLRYWGQNQKKQLMRGESSCNLTSNLPLGFLLLSILWAKSTSRRYTPTNDADPFRTSPQVQSPIEYVLASCPKMMTNRSFSVEIISGGHIDFLVKVKLQDFRLSPKFSWQLSTNTLHENK